MEYIKVDKSLPKHVEAYANYPVITIHPKILRNKRLYKIVINHERIHLEQQKELLIVFFYLFYYLQYAYYLIRTLDLYEAYRSISFEKECYRYQNDMKYLSRRKRYNYLWNNYK